MSVRQGVSTELNITEATEALFKILTLQPDYLLRTLTPLPMESLDELIKYSALSKAEKKIFLSFLYLCPIFLL